MAKKKRNEACYLVTPKFRTAFVKVFTPGSVGEGDREKKEYSVTALIPKDSDMKPYLAAMKAAKVEKFGTDKTTWPEIESPIKDGDDSKYADYDGHKGCYTIQFKASENYRPGVVDKTGAEILEKADFYPGCYARAYVKAWVWEYGKKTKKYGVRFELEHLQKIADGKPFGGKKPIDQVFSPIESDDDDATEENFL